MRRRALLGSLAAAGLAGCLGGRNDRRVCGDGCDVGMSANRFEPGTLTVPVGTTVTWKNTSSKAHTVTAYEAELPEGASYFASGGYDSQVAAVDAWFDGFGGRLDAGDRFEATLEVVGSYGYYCIPHEAGGMVGEVVVTEG